MPTTSQSVGWPFGCDFVPDGRRIVHAAVRIGGSFVFLVDDFAEFSGGKAR
jgi:uncharacterized glyoxalase superfamily protein PhnB